MMTRIAAILNPIRNIMRDDGIIVTFMTDIDIAIKAIPTMKIIIPILIYSPEPSYLEKCRGCAKLCFAFPSLLPPYINILHKPIKYVISPIIIKTINTISIATRYGIRCNILIKSSIEGLYPRYSR